MDRKVLDAVLHPSGWVMITSCPRMAPGGSAVATYAQAMEGCWVTVYHPGSNRTLQFAATCGTFFSLDGGDNDSSVDPFLAVYTFHHKSEKYEGRLVAINLSQATPEVLRSKELAVDCVELSTLISLHDDSIVSHIVSWSLHMVPQHVHTEEKNHSPLTIPGYLLGTYRHNKQLRLFLLTNSGDLYAVCPRDQKLITSVSVSDETVVSSTMVRSGDKNDSTLIYMLTGSSSILSVISPELVES